MESNKDQLTIAGVLLFTAGLLWTARYTMRALAMPHTYTPALLIGGAVTTLGAALLAISILTRQRRR
ncbi:MAG: hypothetical protein HOW97_19450 [Catenulispora sp.]|nr:hypothetical protein [Catenulispora sp.]